MFRSSSSKRTAILVISISSSGWSQAPFQRSPHSRGIWRNFSPCCSKDRQTYQVDEAAGRHQKGGWPPCPDPSPQQTLRTWSYLWNAKTSMLLYLTQQGSNSWEVTVDNCGNGASRHGPWCLTVADSSVFLQREENFIFTSILGSGLHRRNTDQLKTVHMTLEIVVNVLHLQKRLVFLQSAQFHWDTLLHVGIQNLLKLKERQRLFFSWWTIIKSFHLLQLTSYCAELTKLVLRGHSEAIFQGSDPSLVFLLAVHWSEHRFGNPRQRTGQGDVGVSATAAVLPVSCDTEPRMKGKEC